ncbi:MAG: OprO/OprP family phosphate-selective porin [Planctomycetes bacterium]|nr:OprO/OprP family phosphate-selective porin [Planctomycetota bacterium]
MKIHRSLGLTLAASAALGAPAWVSRTHAEAPADVERKLAALEATVQAQQSELRQLRESKSDQWLDERRAEEVKALVKEVLADADTRASLQGGGAVAGYNRGFFIASEDGNNLLRIGLTLQARYIYNTRREAPSSGDRDEDESGFSIRRTQLNFQGNAFGPEWTYRVRLAADADGGTVKTDWTYIGYQLTDSVNIQVGQLKSPFLREELIGADKQLTVERSYSADYFTTDFTQGVNVSYWNDRLQLLGSVNDGSYAWRSEFNTDLSEIALTGRAEYILFGDADLYRQKGWRQLGDFTSWSDDKFAVLLGAAVDYEFGEHGNVTNTPDIFKWTADVSVEGGGWNFFASATGQTFSGTDDNPVVANGVTVGNLSNLEDADQLNFVVQGGLFVIPDKLEFFGRYEWIDFDGAYYRNNQGAVQSGSRNLADDESQASLVTVGGNYYFKKNNAKLTIDVVYALDPLPVANAGQGLLASPGDDQIAVRSQVTFAF